MSLGRWVIMAALGLMLSAAACAAPAPQAPSWAFVVNPPARPNAAAVPDVTPRHVPGSSEVFTLAQVRNGFQVPDWHPDSHPAMPPIVASGNKPTVMACGFCHLPNGQGRPENAGLAGLPAAYIQQQITDFKSGVRLAATVQGPLSAMMGIARNVSDEDVKSAAQYFSQLQYKPWIRVVETTTVPRTRPAGFMLVPIDGGGKEPIGQRIIEVAQDLERTELRDSDSGFIAYVPVGSIRKGAALVTTGADGKTIRCSICHGPDLKGLGGVPPIAGRSPSYIVRQLYDIQHGARTGVATQLMREPVAHLTLADMVDIAAYVSSRDP